MNAIVAARLWLGGASLADLQALLGDEAALEDAIRGEILRAADEDGKKLASGAVRVPTETLVGIPQAAANARRKQPVEQPVQPAHPVPRPAPRMGPTLNLTGYPANLQDPHATRLRAAWDAVDGTPRDLREVCDRVEAAGVSITGEDPVASISNALHTLKSKGLIEKEGFPGKWRRV